MANTSSPSQVEIISEINKTSSSDMEQEGSLDDSIDIPLELVALRNSSNQTEEYNQHLHFRNENNGLSLFWKRYIISRMNKGFISNLFTFMIMLVGVVIVYSRSACILSVGNFSRTIFNIQISFTNRKQSLGNLFFPLGFLDFPEDLQTGLQLKCCSIKYPFFMDLVLFLTVSKRFEKP